MRVATRARRRVTHVLSAPGATCLVTPHLSIKLRVAGWRFAYEPHAVVAHDFRSDLGDFVNTFRNYGRGCREATDRIFGGPGR
jgi:hypothetical protein